MQRHELVYGSIVATGLAVGAALAASVVAAAERTPLRLEPPLLESLPATHTPWSGLVRGLAETAETKVARVSRPPAADVPPNPRPAGKVALVTVLRGSFELALDDGFEAGRLQPVAVGESVLLRADDPRHYGRTGPEGAELLLVAVAPAALVAELAAR